MTPETSLSNDGLWWWNGQAWCPAISANGKYRFDGFRWVAVARPRHSPPGPAPTWVKVAGLVWLALLLGWLVLGLATNSEGQSGETLAVLGGGMGILTAVVAFVFGRHRLVSAVVAIGAIAAVAALIYYVGMMLEQAPQPARVDDGAGVGLVLIGVPMIVALAIVLAASSALGALSRRVISVGHGASGPGN